MPAGNDSSPLVTIITVVFNGEKYLEQTIRSVLNLPYRNLEYLIIDGGSGDGTVDVIKKYDDRITCWISEEDDGIYDAMNKGWALAGDESFVLFLGAGDTILALPEDMRLFSFGDVIYGKVQTGTGRYFNSRVDYHLKLYNTLHHQALLVNKKLHREKPFDLRYRIYADFDFNQRLYKSGANFIRSATFESRALPGGVSTRYPLKESLRIIKKNFGVFWCAAAFFYYLYNTGKVRVKRYGRHILSR